VKISIAQKLLLGRLLTRFGDQAWDFAVPIVLLKLMPNHLRMAALYYLMIRMVLVGLIPRVASAIDTSDRISIIRKGLLFQFIGVLSSAISVLALWSLDAPNPEFTDVRFIFIFTCMVLSGLLGSLGATLMEIAIANDLAPSLFSGLELTRLNSQIRQVDLLTEVGGPVTAGLLLSISDSWIPLLGFFLVVVWNLISLIPEFKLLKSLFNEHPTLLKKTVKVSESVTNPLDQKILGGWKKFFKQPVALVMVAYAFLWLSALSPHGVLLTAFLKDGWKISEWIIGIFRGSGALFGLAATFIFPYVLKLMGLKKVSWVFLAFQTLSVLGAYLFFLIPSSLGQNGFLIMILLSRVGLYGFSLGEIQLRQEGISSEVRGEVNGFANALTGISTLALFAGGAVLPTTEDFEYLVLMSLICVILALVTYTYWMKK